MNDSWISVDERLPDIRDDSVLAYFISGGIDMVHIEDYFGDITAGQAEDGTQLYTKYYKQVGITHWRELPEPPTK